MKGPLPDLAILDITANEFPSRTIGHYETPPGTRFLIRILNFGPGSFDGSVGIRFTYYLHDISDNTFPGLGGLRNTGLQVGDTTTITIEHGIPYPPQIPIRFLLLTDAYPLHTYEPVYWFGREPVPEVSLENNIAEFTPPQ
jgi:hypothetical protein